MELVNLSKEACLALLASREDYDIVQLLDAIYDPELVEREDDSDGTMITVEHWQESANSGCIISSDGCGYFATSDGRHSYDHPVFFCPVPSWTTHVVWYDK